MWKNVWNFFKMEKDKFSIKTYPEKRRRKGVFVEPAQIIISLTFKGERLKIYTPLKVSLDAWGTDNVSQELKDELAGLKSKAVKAYQQLSSFVSLGIMEESDLTPAKLRDQYYLLNNEQQREKAVIVNETIFDHFERYLESSTMKESTKRRIRIVFNHVKTFQPDCKIQQIDAQWFDHFKHYLLKEGQANITVAKNLKVIKQFLNWATQDGLPVNAKALIYRSKLKIPEPLVIALSWKELNQLFLWKQPPEPKGQVMDKCRDLFLFSCISGGVRFSDLLNLKHQNLNKGRLTYIAEKTGKLVEVPINKTMEAILIKYKDTYRPLPRLSNADANKIIKEICEDLDFDQEITTVERHGSEQKAVTKKKHKWISFHDARKTFNTLALEKQIPAHVVDELMGHSHSGVKSSYLKVSFEEKKRWMENLELDPFVKKTSKRLK